MAKQLKRSNKDYRHEWLVDNDEEENLQVAATIESDRYLIHEFYDSDAPSHRAWTITVVDRKTYASVTLRGDGQRSTKAAALAQVGSTLHTFCRHNRLEATCPICSRKAVEAAA
jgi:hypothetical protein